MRSMAEATRAWVESVTGVETAYGELPARGQGCMVKVGAGDPVVRAYKAGGGVYRFYYEVYLRVLPRSEGERLDGLETLDAVFQAIEAHGFPEADDVVWTAHTCTAMPTLYRTEADGAETYQLTANMEWIERS